jgi:hypothetical protein
MKKVLKYKVVLIFLFCLILFSCKKKEEASTYTIGYLLPELRPYMFNVGSYWVYENDSSFVLDSITVSSIRHDFIYSTPSGPGMGSPGKSEFYRMNLNDFMTFDNYTDFIWYGIIARNGNESPTFGQPILIPSDNIGYHDCGTYVWDTINSINILGNTFSKVREMKVVSSEQLINAFSYDTYLFYSDSIGLIKKIVDKGNGNIESWSLKRWNINF